MHLSTTTITITILTIDYLIQSNCIAKLITFPFVSLSLTHSHTHILSLPPLHQTGEPVLLNIHKTKSSTYNVFLFLSLVAAAIVAPRRSSVIHNAIRLGGNNGVHNNNSTNKLPPLQSPTASPASPSLPHLQQPSISTSSSSSSSSTFYGNIKNECALDALATAATSLYPAAIGSSPLPAASSSSTLVAEVGASPPNLPPVHVTAQRLGKTTLTYLHILFLPFPLFPPFIHSTNNIELTFNLY